MPARRPEYWKTPFGQWVDEYGASRIVAELAKDPELAVTREAVTHWLSGVAAPRPSHALALVALSQGRLTLEDIYLQAQYLQAQKVKSCRP